MFASMLGFIITLIIAFFLFIAVIASIVSFAEQETYEVEDNSVLKMELNYPVYDRTQKQMFPSFGSSFDIEKALGLNDLLKYLDKAAKDDRINGIYLDLSVVPTGTAILEELRQAILDFKESGKFVVCYADILTQTAYYLGSAADHVYLHPDGMVELKGISAELLFIKGTLEKLDIDVEVIRAGKYKSAAEPLLYDKMSEANREQIELYINRIWNKMSADIAESRNMTVEELNKIADDLDALNAEKATDLFIVDGLFHPDEMTAELKRLAGIEPDDDLEMVKMGNYVDAKFPDKEKKRIAREKIAVVYAVGTIMGGEGDDMTIGSERISKAIRKARKDDKVKAIVMRVNSPGGDALASEVIRREIELANDTKPVIVSMSDLAASGGYWISCSADKILADEMTLTGSIGVFGLIPNMKGFFNNKLGMTFDYANTNENSDFPTVSRPLPDYQKKVLEREIGMIYEDFLSLVAKGRDMTRDEVHELAQGRVWAARDAFENNLVDEIGGMERAIEIAAEMAEIEDYRLYELPQQKDPLQQLIEEISGNAKTRFLVNELGDNYYIYQYLKKVQEMEGTQARLPFEIRLK